MKEKEISKESIIQLLKIYFNIYLQNKRLSLPLFILPAIGDIMIYFLPPIIISKIIYTVNLGTFDIYIIYKYVGLFFLSFLIGEILYRIAIHNGIKLGSAGFQSLSDYSFNRLFNKNYNLYINTFSGSIVKRYSSFTRNFESLTDTISFSILKPVILTIFAFFILTKYSIILSITLVSLLIITFFIALPIIKKRSKLIKKRQHQSTKIAGIFSDIIGNILSIIYSNNFKQERNTYNKEYQDWIIKWKKTQDFSNLRYDTVIGLLYILINSIGLLISVFLIKNGQISGLDLIVVFSYYGMITRFVWDFNHVYRTLETNIIDSAEFIYSTEGNDLPEDSTNKLIINKGEIEFKNINFNYENNKDALFKGFNLKINAGERVGLVGVSGGGKTTITKLLLRLYEIQQGEILIDGQDIRSISRDSLRKNISFVPQEPILFHRSLADNIKYENQDANQDELIEISKRSHCYEFINKTENFFDTLVGERGVKLSGGQKQRISIARAMLKNSKIIVLDEATSALDSESESYIQDSLFQLMKDKTAIVIAHRLSTIKKLDRIIVIEEGQVIEDGKHCELLEKGGIYKKLWDHQSGGIIE